MRITITKHMKIIIYCQHVLGVGHFFRTLEIANALEKEDLILVTGGDQLNVDLPGYIRHVELPPLMMDPNFSGLHPADIGQDLEAIKHQRSEKLLNLMRQEKPDIFLVELFPFGRKAFKFEMVPVLEYIQSHPGMSCKVICSLRDILVEKPEKQLYETRVIQALDRWFDQVIIHSDPSLIRLDTTFDRIDEIKIPLSYTGFITPQPRPEEIQRIRKTYGIDKSGQLIVASIGGGNVGGRLLKSTADAFNQLENRPDRKLLIFTGPYLKEREKSFLNSINSEKIHVQEFAKEFVSVLGAADLSVSMAGYNTCMNIIAAKVPALVWPFDQNREQKDRVSKLEQIFPIQRLTDEDLAPKRLGRLMEKYLDKSVYEFKDLIDISGAENTAALIRENLIRVKRNE